MLEIMTKVSKLLIFYYWLPANGKINWRWKSILYCIMPNLQLCNFTVQFALNIFFISLVAAYRLFYHETSSKKNIENCNRNTGRVVANSSQSQPIHKRQSEFAWCGLLYCAFHHCIIEFLDCALYNRKNEVIHTRVSQTMLKMYCCFLCY